MLVTAGNDIGVCRDWVVMHLAWLVVKLPWLVTTTAGVEGIARFTEAEVDLEKVTGEGTELITAEDEGLHITRLDTVVVVVVGVAEVALDLVKELASALFLA